MTITQHTHIYSFHTSNFNFGEKSKFFYQYSPHHKGYLNVAHLFSLKGAVGSTPWLWDSPSNNEDACSGSFFCEKEIPTRSSVKEDPDSLSGTVSLLLCSYGLFMPIRVSLFSWNISVSLSTNGHSHLLVSCFFANLRCPCSPRSKSLSLNIE